MLNIHIRNFLPHCLSRLLWGDRVRWGLIADESDLDWIMWQKTSTNFYMANQRNGVGVSINDAGYKAVAGIDFSGKTLLEIGAGDIRHIKHWHSKPNKYFLADISFEMMEYANQRLEEAGVSYQNLMLLRHQLLPLPDESIDVVISFYSLEHLYPLDPYIVEISRVLKKGGALIGAIPAEGGLAWGLGRFLTSRRWFKKNTSIDPDKIICWEHPNFADEILCALDKNFIRKSNKYWPFKGLSLLDLNLVIKFHYIKP